LTDTRPKPLIGVAGRTLLDRNLDALARAGVTTAIVNVHYLPDMIIDHLRTRTSPRIIISDERGRLLDQGGGIRKVLPQLGRDPFIVCNTDAFWAGESRDNIVALAEIWRPEAMDIALLLASRETSIGVDGPGDFFLSSDGRLTRRGEAPSAPWVYSGLGILKPQLFDDIDEEIFGLAKFFFAAAEQDRLFGLPLDGRWLHVGRPQTIALAQAALREAAGAP
ncbi:MAG: nucleotidyltransferase family protein, partial [Alphaproteobacteria bacterium]|nr:nucleotidyltransferase family protein [Alphaproteobacteria bacterium]